mmetsp:Transcript_10480/g.21512  ORF Transcript_10480/g.21512 Transcript_10480/m.21512 type:complete len:189 (-) Transcript_10480:956-1522(-)
MRTSLSPANGSIVQNWPANIEHCIMVCSKYAFDPKPRDRIGSVSTIVLNELITFNIADIVFIKACLTREGKFPALNRYEVLPSLEIHSVRGIDDINAEIAPRACGIFIQHSSSYFPLFESQIPLSTNETRKEPFRTARLSPRKCRGLVSSRNKCQCRAKALGYINERDVSNSRKYDRNGDDLSICKIM